MQESSEPTNMATQKSIKAQKVWLEKANSAKATKSGLGLPPLKLKIHREVSRHITVEEVDEEEETQVKSPRPSVFHRLGTHPTQTSVDDKEEVLNRLSKSFVFSRLEVPSSQTSIDEKKENQGQSPRSSIFNRLGAHTSRTSAFDRLSVARNQAFVFDHLKKEDVEASL